ncbi:MAG: sensor histidine kinase [Saprospiraceae bacterium]
MQQTSVPVEKKQRLSIKAILLNSVKTFFFGGLGITAFFAIFTNNLDWVVLYRQFIQNGALCIVLFFGNGIVSEWFDRYYPWTEEPVKRMIITLVSVLAYTIVASFITLRIIFWFFYKVSLARFYELFVDTTLLSLVIITLFITGFLHGRSFLQSWKDSQIKAEKFKRESIVAQYETLKNQVNPHFLFNSFNVLTSLVHKDANLAEQFIKQLSKVYRYILDTREKEVVSLVEEVEALNAFVFLSKIRYGENIDFRIDIPTGQEYMVAPLSLQMLVENAIKHNIISKANPLPIRVYLDSEASYVVVENKLQKKKQVQDSSGVGLANIKARYAYITDRTLQLSETEELFQVKIPLVTLN